MELINDVLPVESFKRYSGALNSYNTVFKHKTLYVRCAGIAFHYATIKYIKLAYYNFLFQCKWYLLMLFCVTINIGIIGKFLRMHRYQILPHTGKC